MRYRAQPDTRSLGKERRVRITRGEAARIAVAAHDSACAVAGTVRTACAEFQVRGQDLHGSLEAMWCAFRATRSSAGRDRLVLSYAYLVKLVIGRIASSLPRCSDQSTFIATETEALLEARDTHGVDVREQVESRGMRSPSLLAPTAQDVRGGEGGRS